MSPFIAQAFHHGGCKGSEFEHSKTTGPNEVQEDVGYQNGSRQKNRWPDSQAGSSRPESIPEIGEIENQSARNTPQKKQQGQIRHALIRSKKSDDLSTRSRIAVRRQRG